MVIAKFNESISKVMDQVNYKHKNEGLDNIIDAVNQKIEA